MLVHVVKQDKKFFITIYHENTVVASFTASTLEINGELEDFEELWYVAFTVLKKDDKVIIE